MKLLDFTARVISFITNPLIVLFPVPYMIVYRYYNDSIYAAKWTAFSLFFVFVIGVFTAYEVRRGTFSDFDVSKREQRPLLFVFTAVMTVFYLISIYLLQGPSILYFTILGLMIGLLVLSVINRKVKASIHVATITAVVTTSMVLYNLSFLYLLLIPVVAWSRIRINRHTGIEVIVGGIFGVFLTILMYILMRYGFHYKG